MPEASTRVTPRATEHARYAGYSKGVRWPEDTADRIKAMRVAGASWQTIGDCFGVSVMAVRKKAMKYGLFTPTKIRRFTAEEDAILRADYRANVDLRQTAKKIGRSYGSLCQRVFHKHKDLMHTVRSSNGTRAIQRYGRGLLKYGETADEGARVLRQKMAIAKAAARNAVASAKERRTSQILEMMLADIAAGKARDAAIFEARACGVSLERIAFCFNLSRERIRQICDEEAVIRAEELARHVGPERVAA